MKTKAVIIGASLAFLLLVGAGVVLADSVNEDIIPGSGPAEKMLSGESGNGDSNGDRVRDQLQDGSCGEEPGSGDGDMTQTQEQKQLQDGSCGEEPGSGDGDMTQEQKQLQDGSCGEEPGSGDGDMTQKKEQKGSA